MGFLTKISSSRPLVPVLPLMVDSKNKYLAGCVLASIAVMLYLPANHFHFFSPQLLPMSPCDLAVPFLPHSVWVYLSEYLFFLAVYISCKDRLRLNQYFYSFLTLQTLSVCIFFLWPTTYPRELFPLPKGLDPITDLAFSLLRMADTPANCCPSLHVSSVYLSSFLFFRSHPKKFLFFTAWGTAIAISTLTTKQHYLIDVITGFAMAIATHWVFQKWVSYVDVTPGDALTRKNSLP